MLIHEHFKKTKDLLTKVDSKNVANWLLNDGFYPEQYVLPPCFCVSNFIFQDKPYFTNIAGLKPTFVTTVSYPKSYLTNRVFGIQSPKYYHDIVYWLINEWDFVVNHIFNEETKIYSYSFPIPLTKQEEGEISSIRSGRMIYEWIEMAEKDLIVDAVNFKYLVRTDITNFYGSIYTHSIPWALHGKSQARADKYYCLLGNKIDKLMQYSNDTKTNGISVGSALSDLIAEIVLARIDREITKKLKGKDFIGVRFKDDYRVLCNSESDSKLIMKTISDELANFNLSINESKTKVTELPEGLYREHSIKYYPNSLAEYKTITFKQFENTALIALNIHKNYPGTSILEKFLSELFSGDELKIRFSKLKSKRFKEIKKVISFLFLMKRKSEKIMSIVLSVIDCLYMKYHKSHPELKDFIKEKIKGDIEYSSEKDSVFDVIWLMFFGKFRKVGLGDITDLVNSEYIKLNNFYKTISTGKQKIYSNEGVCLYKAPINFKDQNLINYVNAFRGK